MAKTKEVKKTKPTKASDTSRLNGTSKNGKPVTSEKFGEANKVNKGKRPKSTAKTATTRDQVTAVSNTNVPEPVRQTMRERQSQLKLKYRVRPDSALITSAVRSVTEEGGDPRRVKISVDGPNGAVFEIGAHPGVGGDEDLPCSGDVFLVSLAACQELTIRLVASALSLPIHRLVVRVEGDWDVRGTLGSLRESPIGFTALRVLVDLETSGSDDRIERLLQSAEKYCVVGQTLEHVPTVTFNPDVTNTNTGTTPTSSTRAAAD